MAPQIRIPLRKLAAWLFTFALCLWALMVLVFYVLRFSLELREDGAAALDAPPVSWKQHQPVDEG